MFRYFSNLITSQRLFQISTAEQQLFEKIISVVENQNLQTTVRVAGGWVRDRLLGLECFDIDITLDNMTGTQFTNYLLMNNLSAVWTIRANPARSKHLETARVKMFGLDLDFVNLRSEEYTEATRIPQMRFGTPLEDAERRDLTINSLFYNIHTDLIEDWTGYGLSDLDQKIARTPLEPDTTFRDDPLRVLRVARFATRFQLDITPKTQYAMQNGSIHTQLIKKVSKERIGKEYELMMKGVIPKEAVALLHEFGIFTVLFQIPASVIDSGVDIVLETLAYETLTPAEAYIGYTASLLLYATEAQARTVLEDKLKFSNNDIDQVMKIKRTHGTLVELLDSLDVLQIGLTLRHLGELQKVALKIASHSKRAKLLEIQKVIQENRLEDIWKEQTLLNGHEIKELVQIKDAEVGKAKHKVLEWQILHRDGSKDEAIEYLTSSYNI